MALIWGCRAMVPRRYAGPAARGTFFARPATPWAADAQAWGSWVQRMLFLGYWGQVPSQSPMIKPFAVVSYFRMRSAPLVHHVDRALRRMAQSNSRAALSSSAPSGTLHLCCDSSLSRSVAWRLPSIYGHVAKNSTCSGNCPSVTVVGAWRSRLALVLYGSFVFTDSSALSLSLWRVTCSRRGIGARYCSLQRLR